MLAAIAILASTQGRIIIVRADRRCRICEKLCWKISPNMTNILDGKIFNEPIIVVKSATLTAKSRGTVVVRSKQSGEARCILVCRQRSGRSGRNGALAAVAVNISEWQQWVRHR